MRHEQNVGKVQKFAARLVPELRGLCYEITNMNREGILYTSLSYRKRKMVRGNRDPLVGQQSKQGTSGSEDVAGTMQGSESSNNHDKARDLVLF